MTSDTVGFAGPGAKRAKVLTFAKRTFEVLAWLGAVALFAFAGSAVL